MVGTSEGGGKETGGKGTEKEELGRREATGREGRKEKLKGKRRGGEISPPLSFLKVGAYDYRQ